MAKIQSNWITAKSSYNSYPKVSKDCLILYRPGWSTRLVELQPHMPSAKVGIAQNVVACHAGELNRTVYLQV